MKKIFTIINIVLAILLITIAVGVAYIAIPVFGNHALIVRSGSMTPTIDVGSVVVVRESSYKVGDIIAFKSDSASDTLTTHRIIEKVSEGDEVLYKTQGDANKTPDEVLVYQENILGKSTYVLPFVGKIMAFAKSDLGFPVLIIFPALFVIFLEIISIIKEIRKRKKNNESFGFENQELEKSYFKNLISLKLMIPLLAFSLLVPSTLAYYSDSEVSNGNVFQAADSFPTPIPSEPFVDEVVSVTGSFGHCCSTLSSDPNVALPLVTGAPDSPPNNNFIQLSDNSMIIMKFVDNKAIPNAGPDIRIHVFDELFPGTATVEVSEDGITWHNVGNFSDTADVDIEIEAFPVSFVKYIRLTDLVSAGDPYPNLGFDIDAIEALNSMIDTP